MNHIQITINNTIGDISDMLIAQLSEINYNGFQENDDYLVAYINEEEFNKAALDELLQPHHLPYTQVTIPQQNWNEVWESNFEPVIVNDFVAVRAGFHQPINTTTHEIIITPKMSFGTGHHATTHMMMELMRDIDFTNKKVFDFGSGTGILAILAEKLGAASILAVDYDDWCIENAAENVDGNQCKNINVVKGDTADVNQSFDVILANINKNILLDNMQHLAANTANTGTLLLSGLLIEDENDIVASAVQYNLKLIKKQQRGNWIALQFGF